MIEILLPIHIITLVVSMIVMASAAIAAAVGQRVGNVILKSNLINTSIGISCGALMLVTNPVGSRCVVLVSYLAVFTLAHRFVTRRNQSLSLATANN